VLAGLVGDAAGAAVDAAGAAVALLGDVADDEAAIAGALLAAAGVSVVAITDFVVCDCRDAPPVEEVNCVAFPVTVDASPVKRSIAWHGWSPSTHGTGGVLTCGGSGRGFGGHIAGDLLCRGGFLSTLLSAPARG